MTQKELEQETIDGKVYNGAISPKTTYCLFAFA